MNISEDMYIRRHSGTGIEKAKAKSTEYLLQIPVRSTLPSAKGYYTQYPIIRNSDQR